MLGSLCNQTVNLKTDSQTLYYSILKLKYSSSIKAKRNMHHQTTSIRTATEITWTGYCSKKMYVQIDWLIDVWVLQDACCELFCVFWGFHVSGKQDAGRIHVGTCNKICCVHFAFVRALLLLFTMVNNYYWHVFYFFFKLHFRVKTMT